MEHQEASTRTNENSKQEFDFSTDYSENLPALFKALNISLACTSYQASRLMLVRCSGDALEVNFKRFQRPMGLAVSEAGLVLGTFSQVINFAREDSLLPQMKAPLAHIEDDITAPKLKDKPRDPKLEAESEANKNPPLTELTPQEQIKLQEQQLKWQEYQREQFAPVAEQVDACFITRSTHHSGMINIHDIAWGNQGLWAVNSSFSCLCTLEPDYSFVPRWKPYFISELLPEDRCHLNGMALKDGEPAFVTTFSTKDEAGKWRDDNARFNGTLMDVKDNRILLDGLAMPHSPRYHQGKVYFCESGHGHIWCYDPQNETKTRVATVPGFTRGMDFYGSLMFVGLSQIRESDVTRPAPLAKAFDKTYSGIWIFNLEDNSQIGSIKFTGNVDQIYDVAVLTDCQYPEVIEPSHPRMRNHFCMPNLTPI